MPHALKVWPLLTGTIRYEKTISTYNRGHGQWIDAPILAYLIETNQGRILYDVGCDYRKLSDPVRCQQFFVGMSPMIETPQMKVEQRIPHYLGQLGLTTADIDLILIGHLHFDHVGGLCDLPGCEVHLHQAELTAARAGGDSGIFTDELLQSDHWRLQHEEYELAPGIQVLTTPGHTAGHLSLLIELPKSQPIILCGDAADLSENLTDEIAPGCCWQDNFAQGLASIRKLKSIALSERADLWPNHDMVFFNQFPIFPAGYE
ncbi:MAG: N-acyl homoserine lactonase family protein [Nitrosomonas sp.]|nr:N-acyl homoserine lactonase family protein [Nitrosomonas sp.]